MKFDFNALNFEILDANTNAYPDIFINQNGVTFTKKVLDDLNYPAFVLCQLDAKNKVFAVRMCKSSEQRGYKFSKPKGEQKATVSITNKNLVDPIRAAMEGKNGKQSTSPHRPTTPLPLSASLPGTTRRNAAVKC